MLTPGDFIPDLVLPQADQVPLRLYGHAGGRPLVLLLLTEADSELPGRVREAAPESDVFAVAPAGQPVPAGVRLLVDAEGKARAVLGPSPPRPWIIAAGPDLQVRATFDASDIGRLAGLAPRAPAVQARRVEAQAPVLLVPRVLDPPACARLVEAWRSGHEETGIERSSSGRREDALDHAYKRRADRVVTDPELARELTEVLGRRLIPAVHKAFAFRATRFEGFKLGGYASGGFFRRHRDNLSPATAHRRFALSLNLTDAYEGGELVFPEFGPFRYRPAPGEALIFSGSLMHEVTEVTAGTRLVLISFLF